MISVGALAFRYLIMNIFFAVRKWSGDVCSTLFELHLNSTLSVSEVWLCAVLSLLVTALFILFITKYSQLLDEDFSCAAGINAGACNLLTAVITAVIA